MICMAWRAREVFTRLAVGPLLRNSATVGARAGARSDAMHLASVRRASPGPANAPQHHPPIAIIGHAAAATRAAAVVPLLRGNAMATKRDAMLGLDIPLPLFRPSVAASPRRGLTG